MLGLRYRPPSYLIIYTRPRRSLNVPLISHYSPSLYFFHKVLSHCWFYSWFFTGNLTVVFPVTTGTVRIRGTSPLLFPINLTQLLYYTSLLHLLHCFFLSSSKYFPLSLLVVDVLLHLYSFLINKLSYTISNKPTSTFTRSSTSLWLSLLSSPLSMSTIPYLWSPGIRNLL